MHFDQVEGLSKQRNEKTCTVRVTGEGVIVKLHDRDSCVSDQAQHPISEEKLAELFGPENDHPKHFIIVANAMMDREI
jgi:hypothetical protein